MNQTITGNRTSILDQAKALVDAARGTDYAAPSRASREDDIVLGQATEDMKATRTARHRLKIDMEPLLRDMRLLNEELIKMFPDHLCGGGQEALQEWLAMSPKHAAKYAEAERLSAAIEPNRSLYQLIDAALRMEVSAVFPASVVRVDGRVPRIDANWNVVAAVDRSHRFPGMMIVMGSGMRRAGGGH